MKNLSNRKNDNRNNGKQVGSEVFSGNINLLIESAEDHTQVDQFCLYLKTIDNLKISSHNWSEKKGLIITISLKDAVPLGDILRQMPLVGQVYKKRKAITVVLNTSLADTMPQVTTTSEEVVAA